LNLTAIRLGGAFDLQTTNGRVSYTGGGGQGGQAASVNGEVAVRLDPPAQAGHYKVFTPQGQQAWPEPSGPELGSIQLTSVRGSVHFSGGGSGS
ncbi:MAG TPA: hypothetical protein VNM16_01790, partial [Bacillota bacterium]|nr:hypothetical protein [Bacillota bacterium]